MNEEMLFATALEKSTPAERAAFLDEACSGNSALRQRLEALLSSHDQSNFMKTPALEQAAAFLGGAGYEKTIEEGATGEDQAKFALSFLAPSEKSDSLGRLGHHEIFEVIGRGGMGVVLRGLDEKLHRIVAIKVMAVQLATSAAARRRFTREAQAAAAVSHDHIVTIHAVDEANGLPYLVMHYVAGMSLQERLDCHRPLQLAEILRIGMQTASGLAAAHAQGLIHRDIKPANILLENGVERVKITDFGLARAADDASLTQSGVVAGTPQYMAPEQARGESIDQRADLFSLGSVLYAMCTGRAPFRAAGTMAVLNRVCNEMPSPIREANPEVPDWLVAIIEKLHAKNPAERYQSATEVAEVLGRHLAHVQHPSVVPLPIVPAPIIPADKAAAGGKRSHGHRRRWVVAAAALLVLLGGLSLTEATGVTRLATSVIRVFTPDGTLVVETGDPSVKVTVEGDGGLFITGTGVNEIRLRPGSYKVHADRDGRPVPLERELVSIAKGGVEVVRVKVEGASAQTAGSTEQSAFVVLAAGRELKFNGLAEAVQGASDGDTIEVRGNGPFVSEPITIRNTGLTIRAADGFRPAIRLSESAERACKTLLRTSAALRLEGIEFQRQSEMPPEDKAAWPSLVHADGSALHVANCRFVSNTRQPHKLDFITPESTVCLVRNCEFIGNASVAMGATLAPCRRLDVENCVHLGEIFLAAEFGFHRRTKDTAIRLSRNTVVAKDHLAFFVAFNPAPERLQEAEADGAIPVEALENIFDVGVQMQFGQGRKSLEPPEVEALLLRVLSWRDRGNLLNAPGGFFMSSVGEERWSELRPKTLAQWQEFWGQTDASVSEGTTRYSGGDLPAKLALGPYKIQPEDFRLRPDSAGYRAGRDGKDIGADVDLVGPGEAYERWKKTPDYVNWIRESQPNGGSEVVGARSGAGSVQVATKLEKGAFVLQAAGAERKFDTLAAAVLIANNGDTIEVRGNGPFHSPPVKIRGTKLVIRAGDGFRPSIWLQAYEKDENAVENVHLIDTESDLTLEGLEFRDASSPPRSGQSHLLVVSRGHSLRLLNCRFLLFGGSFCVGTESPVLMVSNCEFLAAGNMPAINWQTLNGKQCLIENSLLIGGPLLLTTARSTQAPVQLIRTTVVTGTSAVTCNLLGMPELPKSPDAAKPIRLEVADSIFATASTLWWAQHSAPEWTPVRGAEAEDLLSGLVDWREKRNVYAPGAGSLRLSIDWKDDESRGPKSFTEWTRFWKQAETGSLEGRILFQGGSDLSRLLSAPEKTTPEFFRLRADSAGYRAGNDGKDLGADVDLVGPGPAYESWKKAPAYQEWLKETGKSVSAVRGEPGAFVVIGGPGVEERKFDALDQALLNSTEGDTIEVRGNGPFSLDPSELQHALSIRAGAGFRPVFIINPETEFAASALYSKHPLRLEGLEFRCSSKPYRIVAGMGKRWIANCRFQGAMVSVQCETAAVIRNCELLTANGASLLFFCNSEADSEVTNSIVVGHVNLEESDITRGTAVRFCDNTFVSRQSRTIFHALNPMDLSADQIRNHSGARVRITATENIFASFWGVYCLAQNEDFRPRFDAVEAENWAPRRVQWDEQRNLFRPVKSYLGCCIESTEVELNRGKSLADWNQFWGLSDTGSSEGTIRFHGGDLYSRSMADVAKLTPGDFRLRPDSSGYQAGMDGKDLGADVDLVGPGPAYEKWKESPDYQQWLTESRPVK